MRGEMLLYREDLHTVNRAQAQCLLCWYVSVHCRIMRHVPCASDLCSFASLVEVLKEQGVAQCLGVLSQAGLKSAWDLENCSKSALRSLIGDVALDSLLATRKYRKAPTRPDVPVVRPYARGSLQRIGVGSTSQRLLDDRFARTSRAPRESCWATWQALCSSRQLQPFPVTVEVINAVGSLFKAGRYWSASQYYSVARSKHVETGHPSCQALEVARSQAIRSIVRGMGPLCLNSTFALSPPRMSLMRR